MTKGRTSCFLRESAPAPNPGSPMARLHERRTGRPQHGRHCRNARSGTMSRTCRGARIRGGLLAKGPAESSRLDEASGGRRRAGASQCGRRRRASGRRHAGSGFASRLVRILHGGRCGVGDRTAVPATSLAVADGSIHPSWSPQRHQPVLRVVYAGSGYPAAISAADGRHRFATHSSAGARRVVLD
jgi:hypothetical protein